MRGICSLNLLRELKFPASVRSAAERAIGLCQEIVDHEISRIHTYSFLQKSECGDRVSLLERNSAQQDVRTVEFGSKRTACWRTWRASG